MAATAKRTTTEDKEQYARKMLNAEFESCYTRRENVRTPSNHESVEHLMTKSSCRTFGNPYAVTMRRGADGGPAGHAYLLLQCTLPGASTPRLTVQRISVSPRGHGLGTRVMTELRDAAARYGMSVMLQSAGTSGSKALAQRLIRAGLYEPMQYYEDCFISSQPQ